MADFCRCHPEAPACRAIRTLLAPLQGVLDDPAVNEVMVNPSGQVWVEQGSALSQVSVVLPANAATAVARLLAGVMRSHQLEHQRALETAWLDWRVTAVLPPVARDGACLCLRRHRAQVPDLGQWPLRALAVVAVDPAPATLPQRLTEAVRAGENILVSGSTGAGKTTLLAGLLAAVPASERVLTLEDTPELPVACAHQVRLLSTAGQDLRSLVRLALRLRPDRLVVGEVRGAEAFDLVQAMATGHRGCMGTVHAADAPAALARLEQLILTAGLDWPLAAVRAQLAQTLHLLVHVHRDREGRAVSTVQRLTGCSGAHYRLVPVPVH